MSKIVRDWIVNASSNSIGNFDCSTTFDRRRPTPSVASRKTDVTAIAHSSSTVAASNGRAPTVRALATPWLPHNLDAEASVLGGVILDNTQLASLPQLEPSDFYALQHQIVFAGMRNLEAAGAPIDVVTLEAEIERSGKLDAIGGVAFLGELTLRVPTADNVGAYVKIVREAAYKRGFAIVLDQIARRAARGEDEPDEYSADATRQIGQFNERYREVLNRSDSAPRYGRPSQALLAVDVARLGRPPIRTYSTGLADLDALIGGGLATRQLLSVIGPPGAGKTAFAIATAIRVSPALPVLYVSTELERDELAARLAGNLLDQAWSQIVRGGERDRIAAALDGVAIRLLGSDELPRDSGAALALIERETARVTTETGTPPAVFVDYLQDLARGAERDLRSRVGDLATSLRALAQRLDCPMFVVSSVARSFYSARRAAELRDADDPTVYLSAAKESGDVDYASAVVLFLDVLDDGPERSARIAIAKSRHGRIGFAGARFAGASGRWIPAPESVAVVSAPGRAQRRVAIGVDDADSKVLAAVTKLHSEGARDICTRTQLRTRAGLGSERVGPALDRLVHSGRLVLVSIERDEGDPPKRRRREIYDLAPARESEPAVASQLALSGVGIGGTA